jgi:iron complex transport system substrate-binding protein
MSKLGFYNLALAALSLALSVILALPSRGAEAARSTRPITLAAGTRVVREQGRDGLIDASGRFVPLGNYRRILSGSTVSDSLLHALCEPDRILAYTRYSAEESPYAYRFAGRPTFADLSNLEALVARKPDLVLVSNIGPSEHVARLRQVGLTVFDLGEMRGLSTLLPNIVTAATLLGRPEEGVRLARRFERRLRALAQDIPEQRRPSGLYVSVYGDSIYGGTDGSSYHDVLTAAGVRDAAAARYDGWPRYTSEELLALDPELVVTHEGMGKLLCAHPGLSRLRACGGASGRIVELHGQLIGDPGLAMLDAAETVYEAVHGTQ